MDPAARSARIESDDSWGCAARPPRLDAKPRLVIFSSFVSRFTRLVRPGSSSVARRGAAFDAQRRGALSIERRQTSIAAPTDDLTVWGVVAEWRTSGTSVVVQALADGTGRVFFEFGGAASSATRGAASEAAALRLVSEGAAVRRLARPTKTIDPPTRHFRLHLLTDRGRLSTDAVTPSARHDDSPLHAAYRAAQALVSALYGPRSSEATRGEADA